MWGISATLWRILLSANFPSSFIINICSIAWVIFPMLDIKSPPYYNLHKASALKCLYFTNTVIKKGGFPSLDSILRILIADDQVLFAENLKLMLETLTSDIRVSGIALNGTEAIRLADELNPDIILMDIRMPVMDGVDAAKAILAAHPTQKIVIMTTFYEDEYVNSTLQNGAVGYLLKNMRSSDLITSLRAVQNGTVLLSPQVVLQLLHKGEEHTDDFSKNEKVYQSLGNRERDVLHLLAKGYGNRRIAEKLYLSEATIRNYVSSIYAKLGSNDRLEVIDRAKKIVSNVSRR